MQGDTEVGEPDAANKIADPAADVVLGAGDATVGIVAREVGKEGARIKTKLQLHETLPDRFNHLPTLRILSLPHHPLRMFLFQLLSLQLFFLNEVLLLLPDLGTCSPRTTIKLSGTRLGFGWIGSQAAPARNRSSMVGSGVQARALAIKEEGAALIKEERGQYR